MARRLVFASSAALFAVFAWYAGSNFMTALERSRQKRTMANMRSIATSFEARADDFKSYTVGPVRRLPADTLHRVSQAELERALVPVYARTLSLIDGWGQPIRVYVGGYDEQGRAKDYVVRSLGSDRRAETSRYSFGDIRSLSEDLVFSNGFWLRRPEGI